MSGCFFETRCTKYCYLLTYLPTYLQDSRPLNCL